MAVTAQDLLKQLESQTAQSLLSQLDKPEKKQNFFERFGDDLKFRFGEQGAEIINARVREDQGFASTALQLTGKVGAGSIMDFLGEVLISGGRGLAKIPIFSLLGKRTIGDAAQDATRAGMELLNTELGQKGLIAASKGIKKYQEFAEEHPVMAANIEAVVDIGLLVSPVKTKPRPTVVGGLSKAGQKLEKSAERAVVQNKKNFVERLVTPSQTKKVREAQVGRTTEQGALRSKKVELTPQQKASAVEVEKLVVSPKKTNQGNFNVVSEAVSKEADKLQKGLAALGSRGKYVEKEFTEELSGALARITQTEAVVGDAERAVIKMIARMERAAERNPHTLSGLLRARKQFDSEIIAGKAGNALASDIESAMNIAVREVRQTTNNFINARAKGVGVRRSLDKQFRLLNAMDDIKIKAAAEGNNMLIRGFRNALKLLPFRGEFNQFLAAIFGIGGLGASARFAPYFTKLVGLTGITYIAGKAVMRPGSRKGLAGLLTMIDRAIQKTTDPAVIRQFRLDRAAIVELLKTSKEQIEET